MTLTTITDRVTYQGNGTATLFTYPFMIFAPTDLVVTLTEDATGTVTPLALNVGFSLAQGGIWPAANGQIYIADPPATGYTLEIRRVLPLIQEADFTSQGSFYPDRHERALDRSYAVMQSIATDAGNALKLSADGTVWDGEAIRLTNILDGISTQDAVTRGQLEQVAQNLAAGQAAFSPLVWTYTAAGGQFVFSLPGATITRPDAYTVTWDGVMQLPSSYAIGISSTPFVITFDSIPPDGVTILVRAIGVAETLSSANIDASGVVSGVFASGRLGVGSASDAVFLAGGPGTPTWTNVLNGPLTVGTLTFSGLNGVADTSLITTGVFPPNRLGTGVYGVNTVLHGDGVYRIPAVATTTGFGLSDAVNAPAVFTSMVFTGDVAESFESDTTIPQVKIYIKDDGGGSGVGTLEGYVSELLPEAFGNQEACSVLMNPGAALDKPFFNFANTNNTVLGRFSDNLQFIKVPPAALQSSAGTPDSSTYYRGDGQWAAPVASLGTSAVTDPAGNTPAVPGTDSFFRADNQWSNTIDGNFYVGTGPFLLIAPALGAVFVGAGEDISTSIPITFQSVIEVQSAAFATMTGNDAPDRLAVNGRARALRFRGEGSGMVLQQATATSGAITLDHNAYGHFITTPAGNVTYTFSDGGTDPTSGSYASEFTLEIVNPGANTITWPGSTTWAGGIAPTLASAARNLLKFTKRQGVTGYLGALIGSGSGGFTTEDAQDAVGAMVANSTSVTLTYQDATPSLTAAVTAGGIGATHLATNAVETAKIADGAVTNAKVAAGTLTTDRLAASGTRDSTTVLYGDNQWRVPAGGGSGQASIQFRDEGSNIGGVGTITAVNFTGSGVTASAAGNTVNVNIAGGGGTINWADDGFVIGTSATLPTVSFGTGLSCSVVSGALRVDATGGGGGGGGQAPIQFQDEGAPVGGSGTVTALNVVGAGANLSIAGTVATLTIPGGGSGGGSSGVVYNVRDYGAAGNGVADDTASIQAALNAAAAAGGGIVILPTGTYVVAGGLTVPTKVSVVGSGMDVSTIKLKNSASGTADIIRGMGSYVNFADFTVDGNASNNPTIERAGLSFADFSTNCTTRNVKVFNNRGFGIAFNACTDLLFDNVHAIQVKKKQGFWIGNLNLSFPTRRIKLYGCHAIDCDWDGIHVSGFQVEIIGGHYNGNGRDVTDIGTFGACGIYMDPAQRLTDGDIVISSVCAIENLESGISVYGIGATITNCIVRRNWAAGIVVGGARFLISNCYAEGNGLVQNSGHPFWSQPNDFRFIYSGIASNGVTDIVLTGNRCHDLKGSKTQKWGITAESSNSPVSAPQTNHMRITGNMLYGNGTADLDTTTALDVVTV